MLYMFCVYTFTRATTPLAIGLTLCTIYSNDTDSQSVAVAELSAFSNLSQEFNSIACVVHVEIFSNRERKVKSGVTHCTHTAPTTRAMQMPFNLMPQLIF